MNVIKQMRAGTGVWRVFVCAQVSVHECASLSDCVRA